MSARDKTTVPTVRRELRAGAENVRVRTGFTALRWRSVKTTLSPEARQILRHDLVPVALETFDGTKAEYWEQWLSDDSLDDMFGLVVVFDEKGRPAAWVAANKWTLAGNECLYANSAGVHPDHQGAGLSSSIWRALFTPEIVRSTPRRLHAVIRTANPLVYGAWSTAAGGAKRTSPVRGELTPAPVLDIAAATARKLGQFDRFDPNTMIIREAYDFTESGLWRSRPKSDQTDTDRWFAESLGPRDAIVLVVAFDPLPLLATEVVRTVVSKLGIGSLVPTRSSRAQEH